MYQNDFGDKAVPLNFAEMQFHSALDELSQSHSDQIQSLNALHPQSTDSGSISGSGHEHGSPALKNTIAPFGVPQHEPLKMAMSTSQRSSMQASPQQPLSRPSSSAFTVQDLVRQMQQPSPSHSPVPPANVNGHNPNRTSLTSIFPTPFTPLPGEMPGSGSRPGTAHQNLPPSTAPVPPSRGAFEFQQEIAQMQHNIQARSSPLAPVDPTPSSYYETPTGLNTFIRNQSVASPWERSSNRSSIPSSDVDRHGPQASPFGAIGEARPRSAKTPTSGQIG